MESTHAQMPHSLVNYELIATNPEAYPLPVLKKFESKAKELWFYGTIHSFDPKDLQFVEIQTYFESLKPNLVILEGSLKINKPSLQYKNNVVNKSYDQIVAEKGDFGFGLKMAWENQIEVFCPEPSFIQQVDFLEKEFSLSQIFCSFILEMAVQWASEVSGETVREYLEVEILGQKEKLQKQKKWQGFNFSWENFLTSFKQTAKVSFAENQEEFWQELNDPIRWPEKKYEWSVLNEISKRNGEYRDQFILDKIEEKLGKYDRVLMIYGGHHLYAQSRALEEILQQVDRHIPCK